MFSGPRPLVEVTKGVDPAILNWKPNYYPQTDTLGYKAQRMIFRQSVWNLEFAFKPMRMIYVDLPGPGGKFQRKPVWYMVYRVSNRGSHLNPTMGHFKVVNKEGKKVPEWAAEPDSFGHNQFGVDYVNRTVRFFPRFVLHGHDVDKRYLDQLVPLAIPQIQRREDPAIKLYDTVSITTVDIPVSDERIDRSVWGVVTWVDLDPKIDFFSIYIQGLTNALKFEDNPDAFRADSPPLTGRKISTKTLQLCFWRPGDEVLPTENEIHYGLPRLTNSIAQKEAVKLYGVTDPVSYRWFFP